MLSKLLLLGIKAEHIFLIWGLGFGVWGLGFGVWGLGEFS
jgi:hypothetical protein